MPYQWLKLTGVPADHPTGGRHIATFDGTLFDYVAHVKERRGQSTARIIIDTADTIFDERRYDCGAATGTARGMYLRLYITGVMSGGGEALRAFTDCENVRVGGGVHGAHISLKFGASGSASGLAVANRCTLHLPTTALAAGGNYAAIQAEIWSDGTSSDAGAVQALSFFRVVNDGHANGIADVDDDVFLFDIIGGAQDDAHLVAAAADETEYAYNIRIRALGTTMYLMCASARA